jgi:GNAT superfamily N-acetyltransferase
VVEVTPVTDPDSPDFAACAAVYAALDAQLDPDDPPVPAAERRAKLFTAPPSRPARLFLARDGGEPVGLATTVQRLDGVNDGVVEIAAVVPSAHQRRGVGRTLVRAGLGAAAEVEATSVVGLSRGEAGDAFCQSIGLTRRLDERLSRLRIADVDQAQQRAWIDEAPARAAGYRLEGWIGVCPDDRAEALATALDAMVDEPLDDLDFVAQPTPPDEVVERERFWDRQGYDVVTALATAPDGSPAGLTQILVSRLRPAIGAQSDTGVVAAHRGLRLGRWLKADNLARARAHEPALAVIQTGNAESNAHMLAINVDQGYRPYRALASYQAPVADVRA